MSLNPFDAIEKLINEHGSAVILKERLELAADEYTALERKVTEFETKVSALEVKTKELEAENQALRSEIEEQNKQKQRLEVSAQQKHTADRRDPEHKILLLLLSDDGLSEWEIAERLKMGAQAVRHHTTELSRAQFIHLVPTLGPNSKWHLWDRGRKYFDDRGLL